MIDFWASWCSPCRAENPENLKLYKEFHSLGLNIVGVSLDKDEKLWRQAIKKDNLVWTQISNLKDWQDPIAKLYNVEEIPYTVLIDQTGTIIALNLRGNALRTKLESIL